MQESELEGELLFHAPPSGPTVKFAFSDSEFVAGDLEIMINGVPVRVFVNTQDTRNWGRASEERGSRVLAPAVNPVIGYAADTVLNPLLGVHTLSPTARVVIFVISLCMLCITGAASQ